MKGFLNTRIYQQWIAHRHREYNDEKPFGLSQAGYRNSWKEAKDLFMDTEFGTFMEKCLRRTVLTRSIY